MTYHYHGIDAEESILTKSLPNLGTWALPNLFFIIKTKVTEVSLPKWLSVHTVILRNFFLRFVTIPVTKICKKPLCLTRSPVKKRGTRQALCLRMQPRKHSECQRLSVV